MFERFFNPYYGPDKSPSNSSFLCNKRWIAEGLSSIHVSSEYNTLCTGNGAAKELEINQPV